MWMTLLSAALAQTPPDEAIPEDEELPGGFEELPEKPKEAPWEPTFQPSAGAALGASVHVGAPLQTAALVSLEFGALLPVAGGRLRPLLLAAFTAPSHSGRGEDPRFPDPYTYTLRQRELTLAPGLGVRALRGDAPVNPELIVAPQLYVIDSSVTTNMGSSSLGTARESGLQLGWLASPGLVVGVGPGELALRVALTGTRYDGQITGEASGFAVNPALGYRVHLGGKR